MTIRRKLALDYYVGGFLHVLLKAPTVLLGRLLRRDHDLSNCSSVTIVKLLGGGSLVIAYPSLLALRNCAGIKTLRLVTTPAIRPFAEILGIFDEIIVIRETSLATLAGDSIRALLKLFRCDAIVDLEIHSRLSTVFSLLTCARNRVGFYTAIAFWRKGLSTHLVFCNLSNGVHYFYDQIAGLFGCSIASVDKFREAFTSQLPEPAERTLPGAKRIAIAPCCSELGKERQLTAPEWLTILRARVRIGQLERGTEIYLMGASSDRGFLDALAELISDGLPEMKPHTLAGRFTLAESVLALRQMDLLFCVDSAMLHFGRLIGVTTISYWGPTDPATRLRPGMVPGEEVFYRRTPCSPCVHVAETPPCNGNNVCMRSVAAFAEPVAVLNPIWLVGVGEIGSARVAKTTTHAPAAGVGQLSGVVAAGDSLFALDRAIPARRAAEHKRAGEAELRPFMMPSPMRTPIDYFMDSPACSRLRTLGWIVITKMLARKDMVLVHAGDSPHRAAAYRLFRDVREQTAMLMTDPEAWGIYASAKRTGRVPGDIAELGVFRGGSARLTCEVKGDRPLHLFDTFAGLPSSSESDSRFQGGSFASSFESVKSYLDPFPNVHFHVGMFPASAAGLDDLRFSFVHLDADLYESTLEGIRWFYPRLNPGGILISHDYYGSADGAGKALHEYMSDKPEPFLELSGTQVAIVKL